MVSYSMSRLVCAAVLLALVLLGGTSDRGETAANIELPGPAASDAPAASNSGSITITMTGIVEETEDVSSYYGLCGGVQSVERYSHLGRSCASDDPTQCACCLDKQA